MAIKLTQGADSTIVTAATRAGLATSPKDYSSTFQSVADSYAKSQEAAAEAWGQISGTIALVGAELQKNAEVYSDQAQRVYDAGGTEELVDELYNIKDELKALGSFGGKFGDRETRRKRSQLLAKRSKLFAEIDGWGESLDEASLASKNGLLNYDLMGGDVEFVNAIIASNTPNKKTGNANEARISRDPQTGELIYTLHDMKSGGAAIPGKKMSLSTFKTLIKDSAKDVDNVMGTTLSAITNNAELYGATYGGTLDKYNKGKLLTSIDNITKNVPGLRRAMRSKFGHSGTSFFDELTGPNQTELSSKYFALMLEDIANTTINKETGKKEIKADSLSEDLDANKDGSISQQEINDKYVLFQNSILTGEGPMAKKLFTDFVVKRTEEAYDFGAKQKQKKEEIKNNNKGGFDQLNPFGRTENENIDDGSQKGIFLSFGTRNTRRKQFINVMQNKPGAGSIYDGSLNSYYWDGENWKIREVKINTNRNYKPGDTVDPIVLMTEEKIYSPITEFEKGLGVKQAQIKPLELSNFENIQDINGIFNAINDVYNNKNEKIRQQTGSSGGLRVERTANRIKLFEAGRKIKTFKFNPGGTGSKAFIKSVRGQELLQELINDVNKSLNPEFVGDEYNTTVEN